MIILPPKNQNRFRVQVFYGKTQALIEPLGRETIAVEPIKYKPAVNTAINILFQDDVNNDVLEELTKLWEKSVSILLDTLDGNDNVISTWKFPTCQLSAISNGPFDYATSHGIMVEGHFIGQNGSLTFKR